MSRAKGRTVREVAGADTLRSVLVTPETPIRELVRRLADEPNPGAIFVVDEDRRLEGVLTRLDLLGWAGVQVGVDVLGDSVSWSELLDLAEARQVRDLVRGTGKPLSVVADDTVETALLRMVRQDVADLPVVDEEGRVVADVRLSALLEAALPED